MTPDHLIRAYSLEGRFREGPAFFMPFRPRVERGA